MDNIKAILDLVQSYNASSLTFGKGVDEVSFINQSELVNLKLIQDELDRFKPTPRFLKGTAHFAKLESFIEHFERFRDDNSVVFADRTSISTAPTLTAVYDYHIAHNQPKWGLHKALWKPVLSDDWVKWVNVSGKSLSQSGLAEFLEDNIAALLPAPVDKSNPDDASLVELGSRLGGTFASPSRLMEIARSFQIHATHNVRNAVNTSTGEVSIAWDVEHKNGTKGAVDVPNIFLIGIPVFEFGDAYRIPVRLRYQLNEGKIVWTLTMYRPEQTFKHAFEQSVALVTDKTGITPYYGGPEK